MAYQFLNFHFNDGIATVEINRPEVYNALNETLCLELQQVFAHLKSEKSLRAVVFTGIGKGFCSGLDIKSFNISSKLDTSKLVRELFNPIVANMRALSVPIVCKLNGIAAGAGASLALASDLIISSKDAGFSFAFVNIGLAPDSGATYFLPRLVGKMKAFELLSSGRKITAQESESLGIVSNVVEEEQLSETVDKIVDFYKNAPTVSLGLIKSLLEKSSEHSLEEMLEQEAIAQAKAASTNDFREGIQSFIEKRKPNFKGN